VEGAACGSTGIKTKRKRPSADTNNVGLRRIFGKEGKGMVKKNSMPGTQAEGHALG